jgi:hypothetical protein
MGGRPYDRRRHPIRKDDKMAQRNKKTTMAKLAREHRLRERRLDKQARKDARKQAASNDSVRLGETPEPKEA